MTRAERRNRSLSFHHEAGPASGSSRTSSASRNRSRSSVPPRRERIQRSASNPRTDYPLPDGLAESSRPPSGDEELRELEIECVIDVDGGLARHHVRDRERADERALGAKRRDVDHVDRAIEAVVRGQVLPSRTRHFRPEERAHPQVRRQRVRPQGAVLHLHDRDDRFATPLALERRRPRRCGARVSAGSSAGGERPNRTSCPGPRERPTRGGRRRAWGCRPRPRCGRPHERHRAPASSATCAIRSESVLTTTSSIVRAARAASIVHAMSGLPPRSATFLPGRPFEPPRAGTSPSTRPGEVRPRSLVHGVGPRGVSLDSLIGNLQALRRPRPGRRRIACAGPPERCRHVCSTARMRSAA